MQIMQKIIIPAIVLWTQERGFNAFSEEDRDEVKSSTEVMSRCDWLNEVICDCSEEMSCDTLLFCQMPNRCKRVFSHSLEALYFNGVTQI